jgi:nucleotide-binding universal stress UspA family protein
MKSILVPVDGSESAGRAAAFAATLGRALSSPLTLLYVYDAPAAAVLGLASLGESAVKAALEQVAETSFEYALGAMGDVSGLTLEKISTTGHPFEEIVSHAKSRGCDLIVMGSRGLSPLQEMWLGSVSDRVLRFAPCPVTIVR